MHPTYVCFISINFLDVFIFLDYLFFCFSIRWCRTYFLQRGKCLDRIADPEALVSNEEKNGDDTGAANDMLARVETMHARGAVIDRMEALHHKLCTSFRHAVMTVFSEHGDVLDAGGAVQVQTSCPYIAYLGLSLTWLCCFFTQRK